MKSKEQILAEIDNVLVEDWETNLNKRIADYLTLTHTNNINLLSEIYPKELAKIIADDSTQLILGENHFGATLSEMKEILTPLDPLHIKNTLGAVIFSLLVEYNNILLAYKEFVTDILRNDNITVEDKEKRITDYLNRSDHSYFAVKYFIVSGVIVVGDLAGLTTSFVGWLLGVAEAKANICSYCHKYHIAKQIGATVKELETIKTPEQIKKEDRNLMLNFAEEQSKEYTRIYQYTPQDKTISISRSFTKILSEPIRVTNKEATGDIPIDVYLMKEKKGEQLKEQKKEKGVIINQYSFKKTISALRFLEATVKAKETDEIKEIKTTLTELAYYSTGYKPGSKEKKEIWETLKELNKIYIAYANKNKLEAVKVCTIWKMEHYLNVDKEDDEIVNGEITLHIPKEKHNENRIFTTTAEILNTQKRIKGLPRTNFIEQLRLKTHKNENELADVVFGYSERLEAAGEDKIKIKKAKDYKRKKQSEHKEQLQKWFEEETKNGIIKSWKREKGSNQDYIYKWEKRKN